MIDVERYRRIDEIFQGALELDPSERPSYISHACRGDDSLLKEVEYLLASDEQEWELIGTPAFEMVAPLLARDQPELHAGDSVTHYNVVSLLGVGGMGHVYLAEDTILGRKVALKLLPTSYTQDESRLSRFQQEARAASALNHPNILTIHQLGEVDGQQFIATEFVEGETLRERLKRAPLNLPETLDLAIQIAGALAAAHKAGIVHRDIKPENIMLRHDGYVKVLDFGLAKLTEQDEQKPHVGGGDRLDISSGLVMGTVRYMSPEQARGEQVDPRSDIFSLGVVFYEMLTGHAPFQGEDTSHLVRSILEDEPRPLAEYASGAPQELQRVVGKALVKNRAKRYQTAEDFFVDLKNLRQQVEFSTESRTVIRRAESRTASTHDHGVRTASTLESFVSQIKEHKPMAAAGVIVLVILLAGLGYSLKSWINKRATLPFHERDWVLITSFDNRTGEPLFDGTIESALERELSNSRFVNVISSERAGDVLRLMKKPPDTKIDAATGREICLRDGGTRALVTGRVEKFGTRYVMSVSLIDPFRNQTVVSANEEAANQEGIWPAIRRLSNWTRETLGEALPVIQQSNESLEKVTTPSLRALQLYTQAMPLVNQFQWGPAEQVLKQALTEDPEFASAHIMLAHMLRNQRKPVEEWEPPSQRALQLSGRTSERERYFIEGSYYSMRARYEEAVSSYEALVRQYPDYFWGQWNLAWTYFSLGRYQEMVTQFAKAAELRPNDFWINRMAAWNLVQRDMNEARRVVQRAAKVITPETATTYPDESTWIQLFAVHDLWVRDDIESALNELNRWAATIDSREGPERRVFVNYVANCYLAFGKIKAAEGFFEMLPIDNGERNRFHAEAAFATGNRAQFRKYVDQLKPGLGKASMLARAGFPDEAQKLVSKRKKEPASKDVNVQIFMRTVEGEIALSRGRTAEAVSLLEKSVPAVRWNSSTAFFIDSVSLAEALERQGDLQKAVQVLESASQAKPIAYDAIGSTGQYWLTVQWRLAQVYRKLGRIDDAQKIEAELSRMLAYADPEHPILLQLNQVRTTSNH
jgi:serine/threonine protein kinase/Tfp pilus assembly protein PilF